MTNPQTVTITETGKPSVSKGRGWARVPVGGDSIFATATGRQVEVAGPGVELRRASGRTDKERRVWHLGPADGESVDLSVGTPQSYDVRIDGARLVK